MTTTLPEGFTPFNAFEMHFGVQVPDPVTFSIGGQWLNSPNLYPRQGTVLKIIFARLDLLTDYDHEVIDEWEERFRRTGDEGIVPGVRDRMRYLNLQGSPWFREVLFAMGRRAGKGHLAARAQAYVIWNYLATGDPQSHFGVDRGKKLCCLVFAGKRDQAKATVFGDIVNVVTNSECFAPYINETLSEKLSIYAPHDRIRMMKMAARGLSVKRDMATFDIMPKESTPMAGRGPTSFSLCLDPSTPVLKSDLTWVPIGDIVEGDHVIGFDEQAEKGKQRRLRDAEVQAVWRTRKPGVRLTFDDGSSVTCSDDHQWLSRELGTSGVHKWRTTRSLKVGNRIRHLRDPWYQQRTWEEGYLAGVFDSEGCISSWSDTAAQGARQGGVLTFRQNPGVVADEVERMVGEMGLTYLDYSKSDARRCRPWWLGGMTDAMEFMGRVRPYRLMAKHRYLWEGCAPRGGQTPHGRVKQPSFKTIVEIEHLPEQEMVDITTSTRTFFANGLFSHNCFDEMAHITASGTARSADEVYKAAKPSTDQFKDWAFLVEPSSPWQRMGQFYTNATEAVTLDERGGPLRPNWLLIQLPSWDIYTDWERATEIPIFPEEFEGDLGEYKDTERLYYPPMRGAIQDFDDEMRREKKSNPETFAVEREAKWANVLDAYLREGMIDRVFEPWKDRPPQYGPPEITTQNTGRMAITYLSHGDPAKVNDTFGYAIAHSEVDALGRHHAVFDKIGCFDPADYDDHTIDYDQVEEFFWEDVILKFNPDQLTFDQFNSTGFIQRLNKRIRARSMPKRTVVLETPVTRAGDWEEKESAKAAIYNGLVHAPFDERLRDELKYLQLVNGRVDHPSAGPVQSKDIADCFTHLIHDLIGEQTAAMIRGDLAAFTPEGTGQSMPWARQMGGDVAPSASQQVSAEDRDTLGALRSFSKGNPFASSAPVRPDRGGGIRRRW